ncbi:MAG: acyl carrier protein [Magnetococcus sp. YQC-3]
MENKVKQIVADVLGLSVESVHNDSSPDSIHAWDSIRHMNLVLALEQEFGVEFTEQQIVEMVNVELIILAVKEAS